MNNSDLEQAQNIIDSADWKRRPTTANLKTVKILQSLGYYVFDSKPDEYIQQIKNKYKFNSTTVYYLNETYNKKLFRLNMCSDNFKPLNINHFEYLKDYEKYKLFRTCESQNEFIKDKYNKKLKVIEENPKHYKDIDNSFDKCYKNFNSEKVENICSFPLFATYKRAIPDKIKEYIFDKSEDLKRNISKNNVYKYNSEIKFDYTYDSIIKFDHAYNDTVNVKIKYIIDPDSVN